MLRLLTLAGLFGGMLLAGAAQAVMVDLTTGSWSQFNNQSSATGTFGSNHVTLSTNGTGTLNFTSYDGGTRTACGKLACVGDGVGINDDEMSYGKERLTARFSSAVTLNSVQFLDLFGAGHPGDPQAEGAAMLFELADGSTGLQIASGAELSGAGYLDFVLGLTDVISISFFTDPKVSANSDFALAGLDLTWGDSDGPLGSDANDPDLNDPRGPADLLQQSSGQSVPAPGLLGLMLIGLTLIGLTGARRREPGRC